MAALNAVIVVMTVYQAKTRSSPSERR